MSKSASARLKIFRSTFHEKTLVHAGLPWRYYAAGSGEAIVFLHGGMSRAEMYFDYLPEFARTHQVIAPDLPESIDSVTGALEGIAAVLATEGVACCHIFGHSQGGGLAMLFAQHFSERVRSLMVSSTGLPSVEHAREVRKQGRLADYLPNWLFGVAFQWALKRAFRKAGTKLDAEMEQVLSQELLPQQSPQHLRRYARAQGSLQLNYHSQRTDPRKWSGPVLLLEGARDGFFSGTEVQALHAHFPQAEIHRLEDGGHLDLMTRPDCFIPLIRSFVARHPIAPRN